jgi:uncharacterized protein (DUF2147 family)
MYMMNISKKRNWMIPLLAIPFLYYESISAQSANDLLGKWKAAEDGSRQIEFYLSTDGYFYGKAIGNSSDGKMKAGHLFLQKIWYDAASKSWKGTLHPPDANMSIDARITIDSQAKMKVVGQKFFMTKTIYFTKG